MKTYDLREFIRWILDEFEPSVRIDGKRGRYARSVGDTEMELYGISDMADVLYTIGWLHPDEDELATWRESFRSFENADTGYIHERQFTHGIMHNTASAMGAMNLLGIAPRYPLLFAAEYETREGLTRFLDEFDWETATYGSSHSGAGLASILSMVPGTVEPEWFDWYFAYIDKMFDPANGMVGKSKPKEGDLDQIGGTFHYGFVYEYWNRRMPYPEQRVDAILGLQRDCGDWSEGNAWWMTLDATYLMTRTVRHAHYRVDDVREAVRRVVAICFERVMDPESRQGYFGGNFAPHSLNAALSTFAEAQQFLGSDEVVSERPLQMILDRHPFI